MHFVCLTEQMIAAWQTRRCTRGFLHPSFQKRSYQGEAEMKNMGKANGNLGTAEVIYSNGPHSPAISLMSVLPPTTDMSVQEKETRLFGACVLLFPLSKQE